jgi:hypothetical protein
MDSGETMEMAIQAIRHSIDRARAHAVVGLKSVAAAGLISAAATSSSVPTRPSPLEGEWDGNPDSRGRGRVRR